MPLGHGVIAKVHFAQSRKVVGPLPGARGAVFGGDSIELLPGGERTVGNAGEAHHLISLGQRLGLHGGVIGNKSIAKFLRRRRLEVVAIPENTDADGHQYRQSDHTADDGFAVSDRPMDGPCRRFCKLILLQFLPGVAHGWSSRPQATRVRLWGSFQVFFQGLPV